MTDEELLDYLKPKIDLAVLKNAMYRTPSFIEELRQESYLALIKEKTALKKLMKEDPDSARGFAYTIAKGAILNFQKKYSRHERVLQQLPDYDNPDHDSPFATLDPDLSGDKIDMERAVNNLPEEQQVVIRAIYFEGRSDKDIGDELGLHRWRVVQIKAAALKAMRERLRN